LDRKEFKGKFVDILVDQVGGLALRHLQMGFMADCKKARE